MMTDSAKTRLLTDWLLLTGSGEFLQMAIVAQTGRGGDLSLDRLSVHILISRHGDSFKNKSFYKSYILKL